MRSPTRAAVLALATVLVLTSLPAAPAAAEGYRYRVAWATCIGGSGYEQIREVIPCPDGSVLLGGQTNSSDLPVTEGCFQKQYRGEPMGSGHGGVVMGDCFLMHLGPDGREVRACTFFGGSKQERNVYGMALDRAGNVVITSATRSADLPTTEGAFQRTYGGPPADWMVAKLSADLTRCLWCTYVGGSGDDFPRGGLAVDDTDHVYVVGGTASPNFPTTAGVLQRESRGERDAAIVKLKPDGSGLVWATRLGGGGWDGLMGIRVDPAGRCHVAGHTRSTDFPVTPGAPQAACSGKSDAFLAGLAPDASRLLYATYLGGRDNEFAEHRLALMPGGDVLLSGVTLSPDFPTTGRAVQRALAGKNGGFLARLSAGGKRLAFSTFLGGGDAEFFLMPTVDARGNIFICGTSRSEDFPVTDGAVQTTFGGASGKWDGDGILAILSPDGSRVLYATYLGGKGADLVRSLAIGPKGEVWLVGNTASADFPTTEGVHQRRCRGECDAFCVKLVPVP